MRFRHLLYLLTLAVQAQTLQISGVVSDPQSVPIAEATVTLTSASSAGRKIASTDATGHYSFSGLSAGSYALTFERTGFESVSRNGQLTSDLEVNVTLPIAGEVTSIEVTDVAGKATASRLEIPNRDLPVQISVIPQALLQQQAVNSVADALKNASGVQAFRWYGVYEYYTIRGFN